MLKLKFDHNTDIYSLPQKEYTSKDWGISADHVDWQPHKLCLNFFMFVNLFYWNTHVQYISSNIFPYFGKIMGSNFLHKLYWNSTCFVTLNALNHKVSVCRIYGILPVVKQLCDVLGKYMIFMFLFSFIVRNDFNKYSLSVLKTMFQIHVRQLAKLSFYKF